MRTGSATTDFSVGIPPAAPRNVKAQVNADNSVTVSWTANGEPDLIGYQIQRQDSPSSAPHVVNSFLSATSWTDTTTATSGGDFGYTVIAFRPGADGTATATTVMHSSSAVAAAKVAAPIAVTTTVAPAAGNQNPTTTTTVAAPSVPAAAPDLSAFLAQATKAGAIPTPPPAPAAPSVSSASQVLVPSGATPESLPALSPPDTYAPTLPYAAPAASTASTAPPVGSGVPRVALPGRPAASHQHRSLLFSIAGGLLLCVVGLVVRVANHRPEHLPLEPVTGQDGDDSPVARPSGGAERSSRTTARADALTAVAATSDDRSFDGAEPLLVAPAADERGPVAASPGWRIVGTSAPPASASIPVPAGAPASASAPFEAPESASVGASVSVAAPISAAAAERPKRADADRRPVEGLAAPAATALTAGATRLAIAGEHSGAPDVAGAPDLAGAPDVAGAREVAGVTDRAGVTGLAGAPEVAGGTDLAGAADRPGAPEVAGGTDLAGAAGLASASEVGEAPEVAEGPEAAEAPEVAGPAEVAPAQATPAEAGPERTRGGRTPRPWRSDRVPSPTVGQPGDYFRFILNEPPIGAEQVEVTAPAG